MATETPTATEPGQDLTAEEKISQLRKLFADAPEVGKRALPLPHAQTVWVAIGGLIVRAAQPPGIAWCAATVGRLRQGV